MFYKTYYNSPVGEILLISNETQLIGLWIEGQKEYLEIISEEPILKDDVEILEKTKSWLDRYFNFEKPNISELSLAPIGNDFRQRVWKILCEIPYGETVTYGDIAKRIAKETNKKTMSAQAVGGAVGHNPILIIIPCHRVVGKNGNLTGYAGGLDKKIQLLEIENVDMSNFFMPKKRCDEKRCDEEKCDEKRYNEKIYNKKRCKWCNLQNETYIKYHDEEWGKPIYDDQHLFEMLILESFQAGLSWECVLNKREDFKKAFDEFDIDKICNYNDKKVQELLKNKNIIRNKLKINAAINNSKIFKEIQKEYKSFYNYISQFTNGKVIYEIGKTSSELSDTISKDLRKRGMKFVGTTIIYSYLQAIGVIYSHEKGCFLYRESKNYRKNLEKT